MRASAVAMIVLFSLLTCMTVAEQNRFQKPSEANDEKVYQSPGAKKDSFEIGGVERPGLHNVLRVSDRIYSGSEPHGDEGFESLAKLGITTVVSVDGARPNVEAAKTHGLRYVHIPIGYDGIPGEAGKALARLMREAKGPVYIHCHHGRHRGPAAAAAACIASGEMTGRDALKILVTAGTGKEYAGLWRDVEAFSPPKPDENLPVLVEVAKVDSLAAAMAKMDRSFDNLKLCQGASWAVPADHPDLVPSQEALLVREGLHEAGRNLTNDHDQQFKHWLLDAEKTARGLEDALKTGQADRANEQFLLMQKSCKQCHAKYRD